MFEIVIALEIEPKFSGGAEIARKTQSRVTGYGAAFVDNGLNPADRHVHIFGQPIGGKAEELPRRVYSTTAYVWVSLRLVSTELTR